MFHVVRFLLNLYMLNQLFHKEDLYMPLLQLKWGDFKPPTCMSNVPENSKGPHQCLKVVEIFGFIGYTDQNEATIAIKFAKYLIQNAVALETVFITQETHISTHKRIKLKRELRDILPPGAKLTLKRQTHN